LADDTYRDMDKLAHDLRDPNMARKVGKLHEQAQNIRTKEAAERWAKKAGIPEDPGPGLGGYQPEPLEPYPSRQ
jgi:hypothetical protein